MERLAKKYPPMNPSHRGEGSEIASKWHIDLWECNRLQLIKKGVNANNIHVAGIDTYANYDRFFSARRNLNGRIINGIMMKA